MDNVLSLYNINKIFKTPAKDVHVLHDISFDVAAGSTLAIMGPSGSGKTTLLGISAGLDSSTSGEVYLAGKRINDMDEDDRALLRNEYVGFVFQNFQLIPTLTAKENVMVPAELKGVSKAYEKANELLKQVGLEDRANHYPVQLSGGEQQRIALARAFINAPKILFADEPTGNLDDETSDRIVKLLFDLNQQHQTTLIIVTHNSELANMTGNILKLKGGRITDKFQNEKSTKGLLS
jgi:putative ABC transport system ATP-binding protein